MGVNNWSVFIAFLIVSLIIAVGFTGFAVFNTSSEVTIDSGIKVYADSFDGATTDFLRLEDEDLQAISDMTLERTSYGKIVFFTNINLANDAQNNVVDLDSNVDIFPSYASVNTSVLPSLTKAATIYFYNITYEDPVIKIGEYLCPASTCNIVSYEENTLIFTVTSMSTFSVIENASGLVEPPVITPDSSSSSSGSSGGGAGGGVRMDFEVDTDLIKLIIKQGEHKRYNIKVENTYLFPLTFRVNTNLADFLAISEENFTLEAGEAKIINLDFYAKEEEIPDAYIGKISISSGDIVKNVNIIMEVKEKKPLFDVLARVNTKEVYPGGKVNANITILNLGDLEDIDVLVYYAIKDFENNLIVYGEDSIAIKKELFLNREIEIPRDIAYGNFIFYTKISYGNITATSTDTFNVVEFEISNKYFFIAGVVLFIFIISIALILRKKKKKVRKKKRASGIDKKIKKEIGGL